MAKKDINKSMQLVAVSSTIVFVGLILSKIFLYLYRVIAARYFGPDVYGVFSLATTILGLFVVFSTLGLNQGLARDIPVYRAKKKPDYIRSIVKSSFFLMLLASLILGIILFFSADYISINLFHSQDLIIFLKIFSILVPITVLFNFMLSLLQSFEKIAWYSFNFNISQNLLKLLLLVLLIFLGFKSNSIIYSYLIGMILSLILAYFIVKKYIPEVFGKYKIKKTKQKQITKSLWSYSWPLLYFIVISSLFYWIDTFMIGYFMTVKDVGIYNAAVPIALLLNVAPDLFMQLFFPLVTKEYFKKNYELVSELSKQVGKWIFIITLPVFILIILFPGAFINIIFGPDYLGASTSLRFLAIGALVTTMFTISNRLVSMIGKSKTILGDIIIATLLNIILNVLLVPKFGINGASFATMTSLIVLNALFFFQAKKYLNVIPLRRKMLKILLISLIPTIMLLILKSFITQINLIWLFILTIIFGFVYTILIIKTKCLDHHDIMIINHLKSKIPILSAVNFDLE